MPICSEAYSIKSKNVQRLGITIPTRPRQLKQSFPSFPYKLGDCKVTVIRAVLIKITEQVLTRQSS